MAKTLYVSVRTKGQCWLHEDKKNNKCDGIFNLSFKSQLSLHSERDDSFKLIYKMITEDIQVRDCESTTYFASVEFSWTPGCEEIPNFSATAFCAYVCTSDVVEVLAGGDPSSADGQDSKKTGCSCVAFILPTSSLCGWWGGCWFERTGLDVLKRQRI